MKADFSWPPVMNCPFANTNPNAAATVFWSDGGPGANACVAADNDVMAILFEKKPRSITALTCALVPIN